MTTDSIAVGFFMANFMRLLTIILLLLLPFTPYAQNVQLVIEERTNDTEKNTFVNAYFLESSSTLSDNIFEFNLYEINNYIEEKTFVDKYTSKKNSDSISLTNASMQLVSKYVWSFLQEHTINDDKDGENFLDFVFTNKEHSENFLETDIDSNNGIYYDGKKQQLIGWKIGNKLFTIVDDFPMELFINSNKKQYSKPAVVNKSKGDSVVYLNYMRDLDLPIPTVARLLSFQWHKVQQKDKLKIYSLALPQTPNHNLLYQINLDVSKRIDFRNEMNVVYPHTDSASLSLRWLVPYYLQFNGDTVLQCQQWVYENAVWVKSYTLGDYNVPWNVKNHKQPILVAVFDTLGNRLHLLDQSAVIEDVAGNNELLQLYNKAGFIWADVLILMPGKIVIKEETNRETKHYYYEEVISKKGFYTFKLGKAVDEIKSLDISFTTNTTQGKSNSIGVRVLNEVPIL